MMASPSNRRTPNKPVVSAAKLWRSLCKEGGMKLAWKRDTPLQSYDRTLESDISKVLFDDDSKPLARQLENSAVSTAELLNAFFAALQPFSQMLHDIYQMLDTASASAQDKILRVALKPDGLDRPLLATLEQFREWEERFKAASVRVLVPVWTSDALWALRRAFDEDSKILGAWPPEEPWDNTYRISAGFLSPPSFQPAGERAFDAAAATAYETIEWFVGACRILAPSHDALREAFQAAGGYARVSRKEMDPDFDFLYTIAQAESDYWPVGMVSQVRKARTHLMGLPAPARSAEAARISDNVTNLIQDLPKSQALVDGFEKVMSDIFRLPVWKERSAVYSVWISTQLVTALAPRRITFHPKHGQLNFGFSGSQLATISTSDGDFALWSELRTTLKRPTSIYRKHSIQPDYRILSSGDAKDPASTRVVVECKQYKRPSIRNFTEAVNDYAISCPNAVVALVNYGPIGQGLSAYVEPTVVNRVHFIENFRPASNGAHLKDLLHEALPGTARSKSSWSEPGSVQLSWDAPLRDLDLHAIVSLTDDIREISFSSRIDALADAALSKDIKSGPGQETLNVHSWKGLQYKIFVHNYTSAPSLAGSGARVEVRIGSQNWQFRPPAGGNGSWWHVCTIVPSEGVVTPVGRLSVGMPSYRSRSPHDL